MTNILEVATCYHCLPVFLHFDALHDYKNVIYGNFEMLHEHYEMFHRHSETLHGHFEILHEHFDHAFPFVNNLKINTMKEGWGFTF